MDFLDTSIIVGLIAAIAAVLSASLPYYMTKKREYDVKIQEIKLRRYDELILKLTEYVANMSDKEALHQFILAYNLATGYADKDVIEPCDRLLSSMSDTSTERLDVETTNEAIRHIFKAIRKDININPKAPDSKFDIFSIPKDNRKKDKK